MDKNKKTTEDDLEEKDVIIGAEEADDEIEDDDLEEDEELIRRPLPSFQRGKEKVEHIRAEGVEPFHPITPFSLSQRRSRE